MGQIRKEIAMTKPTSCEVIEKIVREWLRREMSMNLQAIDYDMPFLDLAIDSLGAISITAEIEDAFQKRMNPELLYELDSIRDLAAHLDSLPEVSASGAVSHGNLSSNGLGSVAATEPDCPADPSEGDWIAEDPISYYTRLNRKVNTAKEQGVYPFEPEISAHDGVWVQCEGKRMLMLSSYEYLGLLGHEELNRAAEDAILDFGTGHHGSRLLTGTTSNHCDLEFRLAQWMRADDAIVFSSGYVANLATISALVGPGDYIVGDKLNHASIVDGCRMSGADFKEFKHNDMDDLVSLLLHSGGRRTLVVVDAIFSMEGDIVDLPSVVEICKKNNALLMVDEAHSMGVLGKTGAGIQEHFGLDADDVDIKMGTLSKSLAGSGGFVAANSQIITYLRHHARGYIFSGALPSVYANVAIAALEVLRREPSRVAQIWKNIEYYHAGLKRLGFDTGASETPIVPIMTRSNDETMAFTHLCRGEGLLVVPVCYPAVPMDAPRLRTCITSTHQQSDLDFALDVLARAGRQCGIID
ncbi:8-amino-7-oxononanoate synthase [Novipirellula artificiosorum]|uniref:8-amino-7-oxononanoate synthase n=2 Tax=Novipirellula artificiosorum TaxID=2528016 RepID=A0A5C6DEZ1_9BACT|nr:8-amino-7-oxononanoate synthase [Novipirellula artificiosorum]